ncbi:MAG: ATP-binding protein [Actinomycetota bacterium]|nr:ATP-binding protein [Actinomycetota bacterium]
MSFAVRRRYLFTYVAVAGLAATWGLMMAFSWSSKLGMVAFAPWVALIGFDLGILGGLAVAVISVGIWMIANNVSNVSVDNAQVGVRVGSMVVLGVGSALAGRRLRASEEAQRTVASLQSALIDATLDGICLTDEDGAVLISNRPLRRLSLELGLPQSGTVPERLLAVADKVVEPDRYRKRMLELAHAPGESTIDEFEVAQTGRVFRGYTAPVSNPDGSFAGRIWTLREVTADRELDRMRDAFVATVSHELRTPLTSISGFLEMMQEEEHDLGESGKRYLDVIRRSTNRLHALVEDLLLIAQIEARRVELQLAPVDVAELTARSVEAMRPTADDKGVTLDVVTDHPPMVRGDSNRLTQVLDNLVSNAVKFTNDGGTVSVSISAENGDVRLVVADTGIGVPLEEQGQVFSRFFRASTATRLAIPGTGLGLAISRALVEQHGGTITFKSQEGEGTQVVVILPSA